MRVFADNAADYAQAGWPCIIPVPVTAKFPPPPGFTGADGADTDPMQLVIWVSSHAEHSIALRMPDGVIGIDVDHYDKGAVAKRGSDKLAELETRHGALPATWSSTARGGDDGPGPSRIMFFRVPAGRYVTNLGDSIEIIQRHHRYAVVAPSVHSEVGDTYRWYDPAGLPSTSVPKPVEFAELPAAWVAALREGATEAAPPAADVTRGQALLAQVLADERQPCAEVTSAAQTAAAELAKAGQGSRHDTTTARVHHLVQLGAAGHPGVGTVLAEIRGQWTELTAGEDRAGEFDRMALTSARKAVTVVGDNQVPQDPCLLTDGRLGPVIEPKGCMGGGPDVGGSGGGWNIRTAIGTYAFDPHPFDLDQTLAEAVLERMQPVLRYAADAKAWLLRGGQQWEACGDLTKWAVAEVARLMPHGDNSAGKDSDAYKRAQRRTRFHTSNSASAIAAKMKDLVVAGRHPSTTNITALDTEPDVLWAGGIAWDLRASREVPTPADIDPGTPHMHTASVAPEVRPTPLWDAFVAAVWPDPDVRAWALRVLSIALTGYPDAALPILFGPGGRGKTSIVDLLVNLLGSYAHSADPRLLGATDNTHASIIYDLKGLRLAFIDEGPREGRWAQERLKQLTGGAELTGNAMRENPIKFRPTHTLILTTNTEPILTDPAIQRRVRLIPCEGDEETVKTARVALLDTNTWQAEAPGILAAMMREAAAWLADRTTAETAAAPVSIRGRVEEIAEEQDPVRSWLEEETEPYDPGTRSNTLYEAFRRSCQAQGIAQHHIPSKIKWGRALTKLGVPTEHDRRGSSRPLRLRDDDGWRPLLPNADTGTAAPRNESPALTETPSQTHASKPVQPSATPDQNTTTTDVQAPRPDLTSSPGAPNLQETAQADPPQTKKPSSKQTSNTKAAKAAKRAAAVAEAAGESVPLPAAVDRAGTVVPLELNAAQTAVTQACERAGALTVDVENTGYPVGHRDYALRTVQLGDDETAVVFNAADPQQTEVIRRLLVAASRLHAHSATADLVPLVAAGLCDTSAWERMHDTVIPAKLADPASTGSDPGLKKLSGAVLGERAVTPAADAARGALFKAGRWLTDTKVTTPVERSGWAQVDSACTTMVRYAAADVLDTAALAKALPETNKAVAERERTVQRMTARVTHRGLRIDGEHAASLLPPHTAAREQAREKARPFGIDNPGSSKQVAATFTAMGAELPLTDEGNPSVAKDVLEPLSKQTGPIGDLARIILEYRHHNTVIGTFLQPYLQLVKHGDERTRPTVYTIGTSTGRMACIRPNMQQLPRQGGVRACITADPGHLLISADFKSVELRVAAALSGDTHLTHMINNGMDVHKEIARQVWGPEATKADRYTAKRIVFGRIYGGGVPKLAKQAGVDKAIVEAAVGTLDALAPDLAAWSRTVRKMVEEGCTQFPTYAGRIIHLPAAYPHKAPNYCIQGTARELLVDALLRWRDTRWGESVLLPVHDEILATVPEDDAEEATAELVRCMTTELHGVPITAEASDPAFAWADSA